MPYDFSQKFYEMHPQTTGIVLPDDTVSDWITELRELVGTFAEAAADSGVATGGSGTTIVDTTKSFATNMWADSVFEVQVGATKYLGTVISNTATTITFAALAGGALVVAGSQYSLKIPVTAQNILKIGGTTQTGSDWSTYLANINKKSQSLTISNVTCTAANTEYTQALPANCKQFTVKVRGGLPSDTLSIAFTTGLVPPGTGLNIVKILNSQMFNVSDVELTGVVVYVSNTLAGAVVEIIAGS